MIKYEDFAGKLKQVHEYSNYMSAVCPFHTDGAPSLLVYKDGWFRCLGCNRQGTWKTLWNRVSGQPITPVIERQTKWKLPALKDSDLEEICYKAHNDLLTFPTLGWYLEMRGLEDCIETCEIGYWNGWYTVPVRDRNDNFVTAVLRAAPHVQMATGIRYWSRGVPTIYSPNWRKVLDPKNDYYVVTYGLFDSMVISMLGHPCITPTSGMVNIKGEWLDDIRKRVYVIPDQGEEHVAMRLAGDLGWRGSVVYLKYPNGIKDPAGFLEKGKRKELEAQLSFMNGGV